jgi:hypothetical protein
MPPGRPDFRIQGIVTIGNTPSKGTQVRLSPSGGGTYCSLAEGADPNGFAQVEAVTNEFGNFTLERLDVGAYVVRAMPSTAGATAPEALVTIVDEDIQGVNLMFPGQ